MLKKIAFERGDTSVNGKMAENPNVSIIMLGESGVGKTSLLLRFSKNIFKEERKSTSGIDKYNKTITLNNKNIELELWDTVGQERFRTIVKNYFRRADGVLLVYDMTVHETFIKLPSWLDDLRKLNEEATVLIVGNKADLQHLNQVARSAVENYATAEGLEFSETSAKNNENVDEVFEKLALKVLARKQIAPFCEEIPNGEIEEETSNSTVSMSSQTEEANPENIYIISLADDYGSEAKKKKKGCCN